MLGHASILDLAELERRAVILDGDPAGLAEDQHEERGQDQQMAGPHDFHRRRSQRRAEHVGEVGVRGERHHEHHEDHGRLVERAEGAQPARAELRVGAAAVDRGDRDREPRHAEDQPAREDVAHVSQRQPEARQHRNQHRHRRVAGEAHIRGGPKQRTGGRGQHRLLVQQLGDVVVGLQHPRPGALLDDRLSARDQPAHQRRKRQAR